MPSGVFKPYAGVSTAVLFFTKTGTGGTDKVWFYDMEADGYSLDDKRNEIKENDIPDLLNRYHNLVNESERARTDKSFLVPFDEIKSNDWDLSINRYKEIIYEEIEYAAPTEIIKDIETLDQETKDVSLLKADICLSTARNQFCNRPKSEPFDTQHVEIKTLIIQAKSIYEKHDNSFA